ncbi:hypothetical protein BBJ28_00009870 [Nothophytophthora sp. Chile5]|nr:hypothetical protein BBJ28_00009870 [Nothophytophthora sp. Chile5]
MQRGPHALERGAKSSSARLPSAPAACLLPTVHHLSSSPSLFNGSRGPSPNAAKRSGRSTAAGPVGRQQTPPPESEGSEVQADSTAAENERGTELTPLREALEVLEALLGQSEDQPREAALEETRRLRDAEQQELERTRLAADEQLHTTLELLRAELSRERRLRGDGSDTLLQAPTSTLGAGASPRKRQTMRLALQLRHSPLKPRGNDHVFLQRNGEAEETRQQLPLVDEHVEGDAPTSIRDMKLRELREERARWQRDYEAMREQVVEEKARQVALFQRLEAARRTHTRQLEEAEVVLRASQEDAERLQARLAQVRVSASHEAWRTATLAQSAHAERQRLVCALAETRHKFREWKEGEAATLRATREQAVNALRTEYELKVTRHQEEKQKLRDKVKDLEVSLRLLQRDRHLSPGELSERKGTLLLGGAGSASESGGAELIEAQGRIQELEALLTLEKERQERQEALLRASEAALARLSQERELSALESLALPLPAMASHSVAGVWMHDNERAALSTIAAPSVAPTPPTADAMPVVETGALGRGGVATAPYSTPVTPARGSPPRPSATGASGGNGGDVEKEILRRRSVALSAEVNRYQQIVVQSMEEVRALKESRRLSRSGSGTSTSLLTARESYLLEELAKAQREAGTLRKKLKQNRKEKMKKSNATEGGDLHTNADTNSSSGSDSDCEELEDGGPIVTAMLTTPTVVPMDHRRLPLVSEHEQVSSGVGEEEREEKERGGSDKAVVVIQTRSKGFLARREFIQKKLAIGKIKARYRGYLVRKSQEALGNSQLASYPKTHPSRRTVVVVPELLLVTEAMQFKMLIVEPHHETTCQCEGDSKGIPESVSVILRVSKNPPIVQLQMSSSAFAEQQAVATRVAYFHLFETIALLPFEDEETVLGSSSEKEIARILASRLAVEHGGSDGEYRFFIRRPMSKQRLDEELQSGNTAANGRGPRTPLTELPVQPMSTRVGGAAGNNGIEATQEATREGAQPGEPGQEEDLDILIRDARTDPLDSEDAKDVKVAAGGEAAMEEASDRVRRLVKQLSSRSFRVAPGL